MSLLFMEMLKKGMKQFLEDSVTPDRKLTSAIRGKIEDVLEVAGVSEEGAALTFERVIASV